LKTICYKLTKEQKLLDKKAYSYVFDDAKKVVSKRLLILYRPNLYENPRLGLIIQKKNIRCAHDRNRFKRAIRESFRLNQHDLNDFDIVVMTRRGHEKATLKELFGDLDNLWKKLTTCS
jgi:ribonuclease P protein component